LLINTVKIFVKNPEVGKVKTRLASKVGEELALKIYQQLLSYTEKMVSSVVAKREVWYSQYLNENDLWDNELFEKNVQIGDNLGSRMRQAFQESYLKNENAKVVLIGSDCAELEKAHINDAFEKLTTNELVIGPAKDGGYYLIGMSKFMPEVFDKISWSTSQVLEQTLKRANGINASYYLLEKLNDVDEVEDWEQIKHKLISHD